MKSTTYSGNAVGRFSLGRPGASFLLDGTGQAFGSGNRVHATPWRRHRRCARCAHHEWVLHIIVEGEQRDTHAVAFVTALRRAWRDAGEPEGAAAFVNRGSASRCTFLLSPGAATLASGLPRRAGLPAGAQREPLRAAAPLSADRASLPGRRLRRSDQSSDLFPRTWKSDPSV